LADELFPHQPHDKSQEVIEGTMSQEVVEGATNQLAIEDFMSDSSEITKKSKSLKDQQPKTTCKITRENLHLPGIPFNSPTGELRTTGMYYCLLQYYNNASTTYHCYITCNLFSEFQGNPGRNTKIFQ
jgi:hypothetical protein